MNTNPPEILRELIKNNDCVRIAALGSSNTQRRVMGMHWFDYIELACKFHFGKGSVLCCNMGVGGEKAGDLLNRFDRDCGRFEPHLAIITCGGNDSFPDHNVSAQEFYDNMHTLYDNFSALGTIVFFQTYYACDLERLAPAYAEKLVEFMQIIRNVAKDCNTFVQDNFVRWAPLYENDKELYRSLMIDNLHVNEHGNAVIGLDWLDTFQLEAPDMMKKACTAAGFARKTLDLWAK